MADKRKIRVRVGHKGRRLEVWMPKTLTEAQLKTRRALIMDLAASLRPIPDPKGKSRALLARLALEAKSEEVPKLEKAIRRFIREPAAAPADAPVSSVTFREFALHWATNGLADEYPRHVRRLKPTTMRGNKSMVAWLNKEIGHIPLVRLTKADCDRALDKLPKGSSNSTVRHHAQVIQTVLRRAVHPANIITQEQYPLPHKWLPPTGKPPSFPFLYPQDVIMLLSCSMVPTWRRVLYALAIYEGQRLSALLRLRYANIDFNNGHITAGPGKTHDDARTWKLNAGTLESLVWSRGEKPLTDFILPRLTDNEVLDLSSTLRGDLMTAGVTRDIHPDLFAKGNGQALLRFHDLRATFVSLHLAMGWSEVDVMIRTQHTSTKVLHHHYARRLGLAKSIIATQGPLPPMDEALGITPSRKAQKAIDRLVGRAKGKKGGAKGGAKKRVLS